MSSSNEPSKRGGEKGYSSLILNVTTPEMANSLVGKGLVEAGEIKRVEMFEQSASVLQCFRCQGYGHMARGCTKGVRCAECAQAHDTRDHQTKGQGAGQSCAPCGQKGHPAWYSKCPARAKERQRAAQRVANKPPLYRVREVSRTNSPDAEGFTVVEKTTTKKKRKANEQADIQIPSSQESLSPPSSSASGVSSVPRATNKPGRPRKLGTIEQGQKTLLMKADASRALTRSVGELVTDIASQDQARDVDMEESSQEEL